MPCVPRLAKQWIMIRSIEDIVHIEAHETSLFLVAIEALSL